MINGKVVTSGTPTKYVPVNSSSDSRKTKIAAAISPGAANGKVTVNAVRKAEAPRLRAANSSSSSTAANAAVAIHTAMTRPCAACTSTTPAIVPLSPENYKRIRLRHERGRQRLGVFQIGGIEALGEPAEDGRE